MKIITEIGLHVLDREVGHQAEALLELGLQQPGQQVQADQRRRVHDGPVQRAAATVPG